MAESPLMENDAITIALTGASGARYGLRLIECLLRAKRQVDLLLSDAARTVLERECDLVCRGDGTAVTEAIARYYRAGSDVPVGMDGLRHYGLRDWMAPMASGSSGARRMVVCPCSMGTLAAIAGGLSDTLIERAADVAIKEARPLILVPRETPLSPIHLQNMLALSRMGVMLLPAAPGFYHRPQTVGALVDFIVARILDQLGVTHGLIPSYPDEGPQPA